MLIIGLTGLIGSGKSTVAEIFAKLGIKIIDTDQIAHQLTKPKQAGLIALVNHFGSSIITQKGELDRYQLRELVFNDETKRQELENILHPLIFNQVMMDLGNPETSEYSYVIIAVPLLFRSQKYLQLTQRNIFVDSDYELLLERLLKRSALKQEQVDAILAQQVDREQQIKLADDVIQNNGDLDELEQQVINLHHRYLKMRFK